MIAVVACGNPNRSDDGAALAVLEQLRKRDLCHISDLRLLDAGTDGMATMFAARGCRSLIIVDACRSGSEPGAIFEVPGSELRQTYAPNLNLHDFRWDHALHAGKAIFREQFPDDVKVFLIEAQTLDLGVGLSSPVSDATSKVADRIQALLEARSADKSRAVPAMRSTVSIRDGALYVSSEVYARFFGGVEAVILLRRDSSLFVLPVRHAASGGYLLKIRNRLGDRVVNAPDFFRENGLADESARERGAVWSGDQGALVIPNVF